VPIKIKVKDFKSIGNTSLVISGFTVITGTNNFGKSNLWRAIFGVFHNKGSDFVRRKSSAPHAEVEILFDDGNLVRWEKSDKVNRYEVNGHLLEKVGRGVPEEVQAFKVGSIPIAGEDWSPQFAKQLKGQVFMLDKPGSTLAEAISDVDSVARINSAMKLAEKDRRSALADLKLRKGDLSEAQNKLQAFKGLDPLIEDFDFFKSTREGLLDSRQSLQELISLKDQVEETEVQIGEFSPFRELEEPESDSVLQASKKLTQVTLLFSSLEGARSQVSSLVPVRDCILPDKGPLEEVSKEYLEMASLLEERSALEVVLGGEEAESIAEIGEGFLQLGLERCLKLSRGYDHFLGLQEDLQSQQETIEDLKTQILKESDNLGEVEVIISDLLEEIGACPTCGRGFNALPF